MMEKFRNGRNVRLRNFLLYISLLIPSHPSGKESEEVL